jgi:hypothetical protein
MGVRVSLAAVAGTLQGALGLSLLYFEPLAHAETSMRARCCRSFERGRRQLYQAGVLGACLGMRAVYVIRYCCPTVLLSTADLLGHG